MTKQEISKLEMKKIFKTLKTDRQLIKINTNF